MNSFENEPKMSENGENTDLGETEHISAFKVADVRLVREEQPETPPAQPATSVKRPLFASLYDYLEVFCYALAMMLLLFLFVFRLVTVDGNSMQQTLDDEDRLIISNLFYTPKTGDIIVINPESHGDGAEPIIKRVIATEGQTVRIDYANWEVYVDGKKLDEPYIDAMREIERQKYGNEVPMLGTSVTKYKTEFTVGKGKVFVMGDNRNNSKDSRHREYGEMGVNRILGKVILRISPNFGTVD
jgi:signal peptidase I